MRVAFLSAFYPYSSDIVTGNNNLYRALEQTNEMAAFNYSLLYPDVLFPGRERYVEPNEVTDIVESQRLLNTANPASYYFTASAINAYKPKFMLTRLWMPYLGAALGGTGKLISKEIKRIAIVDTFRANEKIVFEEKASRLFVNNYDAFIVLTANAKEDLLSLKPDAVYAEHPLPFFSASGDKIAKDVARKILNLPLDKKIMLFFGTVRKYKGVDVILHALSQLDDSYHLLMVGDSPSGFDAYHRRIRDLNISAKVTLIERVPNINEIPYFFYASDVLLMPLEEDAPMSIISKTLSYELPVIVSDVGQFKEIYEDKKFGLVIERSETELLVNAIKKYYNEKLEEQYRNNLNALRYDHSWQSLATIIFDLYERLLIKEDTTIY
jgi:glycosyltransferase involved in cell wall biosynthesis